MKIFQNIALFIHIFIFYSLNAQESDTVSSGKMIKRAIFPSTLIISGAIISGSQFEKDFHANIQDKAGDPSGFQIENYLQYAPIAEMYIADAFKIKSKHHWFDQTKYLLISNIITSGITHSVKYLTSKTRPNGADYSFPSGHTSFSFTNGSVLFNEFHKTSPVFAYSGYAFALTTGTLRMVHNKHWLSDVLVGAGLGILVTDLVYYFEPFKNFNPFKKSKNITFFPHFSNDKYGFYLSYKF